ncbi:MAG: Bax inhibitor-1/YccA family protein [Caldilineaceae bacterium]
MGFDISTLPRTELRERSLFQQVYAWMAVGLGITGFVAYAAFTTGLVEALLPFMLVLVLAELGVVLGLSFGISRMSAGVAAAAFVGYALLNGLTLSTIFLVYTQSSIASTFFITAATFGCMSMVGYTTQRDLTSLGSYLFMGLIGLIIASLVNLFFQNEMMYWVLSYVGIALFMGLTAYDTNKIKQMSRMVSNQGNEVFQKVAIMGALRLYLDFVNLFLYLLRLFGRRR